MLYIKVIGLGCLFIFSKSFLDFMQGFNVFISYFPFLLLKYIPFSVSSHFLHPPPPFTPVSPISAGHVHRLTLSPSETINCQSFLSCRLGFLSPFHFHTPCSLVLCISCADDQKHCDFMSAAALSHPQDMVSKQSFLTCGFYYLSGPFFLKDPLGMGNLARPHSLFLI